MIIAVTPNERNGCFHIFEGIEHPFNGRSQFEQQAGGCLTRSRQLVQAVFEEREGALQATHHRLKLILSVFGAEWFRSKNWIIHHLTECLMKLSSPLPQSLSSFQIPADQVFRQGRVLLSC